MNDKFIKVTKIKLILMCLATLLPIIIVSSLETFFTKQFGPNLDIAFTVLRYFAFALCEASIIFKIVTYILIIVKPEFREKVYTKINDERNIFIKQKAQAFTIKTILFLNALLLIVFGFIDPIIFIVIAVEEVIILAVYLVNLYYYSKKY